MDFLDAIELFRQQETIIVDIHAGWEKQLETVKLPSFPVAVSDLYLDHLCPLYKTTKTGNIIRDVLCNIVVQQCSFNANPLFAKEAGINFHVGDLGSSALPAACLFNLRVTHVASHGFIDQDKAGKNQQQLLSIMQDFFNKKMVEKFFIRTLPVFDIIDSYLQLKDPIFSVLHIANQPSAALALEILQRAMPGLRSDAIILFSGERDQILTIKDEIVGLLGAIHGHYIDTVTISATTTASLDGLLIMEMNPLLRIAPPAYCVVDVLENDLRRTNLICRDASAFPNLSSPVSSRIAGVWNAADGSEFPYPSTILGVHGADRMVGKYVHKWADVLERDAVGLSVDRWKKPLGRFISLPGGRLVDQVSVTAEDTIVINSIMYYLHLEMLEDIDRQHWLWQGKIPEFPEVVLDGEWVFLHAPHTYSHWVQESLLPLGVLTGLGASPRLLYPYDLCGYQKQYLELCGFPLDQGMLARPGYTYRCGHLYASLREMTPFINKCYARVHHPLAVKFIERMLDRAGVKDRQRKERLYISRLDRRDYRALLNEERVISYMTKRGYRVVNGSTLSMLEALFVYGNARIIVGAEGAGLQNSIFSPPGCQIVCFAGRAFFEEGVDHTSHMFGHDYARLVCEFINAHDRLEGTAQSSNYIVDILELGRLVDEAESRANALP